MQTYLFYGSWKELTNSIRPLLYKWIVKEMIKENYITSYKVENKKLIKKQIKKVIFITDDNLDSFLKNNSKFKKWI